MTTVPETMHLCIANAVGVTTGERNGERVARAAAAIPGVDVIVVVEADDIEARDDTPVLSRDRWRVFHRGGHPDKDGTLLAFRRSTVEVVGDPSWTLCTPDHLGDRRFDINPRWALTVPVRFYGIGSTRTVTGVHFPPPRAKPLLPLAYQAMRDLNPDVFAGDLNLTRATVQTHFPTRDVRGREVMHAVAKKHMHLGRARAVELAGSDHPGVLVSYPAARRVD
jgi:hypothetical protein